MQRLTQAILGLGALALAATVLIPGAAPAQEATLYKNPSCGCCQHYADYLGRNGFEVSVVETEDLAAVEATAGVPEGMESCHVMFVDGYAVSGHIPVETVRRLLAERPAIRGITLPGMPAGSPGMGGSKSEPFVVHGFGGGPPEIYAVE